MHRRFRLSLLVLVMISGFELVAGGFLQGNEGVETERIYCNIEEQKAALLDWKGLISDQGLPLWGAPASWTPEGNVCTWPGITCSNSDVTDINLLGQQLHGPLPRELSCFGGLMKLDLGNNHLSGPLPAQWSRLTSLNSMNIASNHMEGILPMEYSALSKIASLKLDDNRLTGTLPPLWKALTNLRELRLNKNSLSGTIPDDWAALTKILVLNFKDSGLETAIPDSWLQGMKSLQELITGGASDPGMTASTSLELLPPSLQVLELSCVGLKGPIPASLSTLTQLTSLKFNCNMLTGTLPVELSALTALNELDMSGSNLSGPLPSSWSALRGIRSLYLGGRSSTCSLNSSLPTSWSTLTALQTFEVSYCNLSGSLPSSYSSLVDLSSIDISFNRLTGTLPPAYSTWTNLSALKFHGNVFTGPLPLEYSAMLAMDEFLLYINSLTGTLPDEYTAMKHMTKLSLRSNAISGTIPESWLTGFPIMSKLALSHNRLTGSIPASIGSLNPAHLKVLWLGEQDLTGTIPSSISLLTRMEQLHLHNAQLSGTLPDSISTMANHLTDLSLGSNNLTGTVPVSMCSLAHLEKLRLHGNNFVGALPGCLVSSDLLSVCAPTQSDLICFTCGPTDPAVHASNPKCACTSKNSNAFCGAPPLEATYDTSCFTGATCPALPDGSISEPHDPDRKGLSAVAIGGIVAACCILPLTVLLAVSAKAFARSGSADAEPGKEEFDSDAENLQRISELCMQIAADDDGKKRGVAVTVVFNNSIPEDEVHDASSRPGGEFKMDERVKAIFEQKGLGIRTSMEREGEREYCKTIQLLASGGMGRVYKAIWRGVTVAQKIVTLPDTPTCIEKQNKREYTMAMEAAISASMCHPNVVQTYCYELVPITCNRSSDASKDASMTDGTEVSYNTSQDSDMPQRVLWEAHIIQEFCSGGSLDYAIKEGRLARQDGSSSEAPDLGTALSIARDVAAGMVHVHAMQIIHGDLKTGNVLLQPNGKAFVAKVADFGLSMQMDTQATHISNVKGGTLTHMSPELMQSNQNSPAADVYAFGILMFELFGGKRAWEGMTPPAIMSTVMQRRRPVFSSSVPVKVVEIATSCWVHNPGDRPSFKEVLHKLDIVIQLHSKGLLKTSSYVSESSFRLSEDLPGTSANGSSITSSLDSDEVVANFYRNLQMQGSSALKQQRNSDLGAYLNTQATDCSGKSGVKAEESSRSPRHRASL